MGASRNITIIKLNLESIETWRYTGEILQQDTKKLILQAYFNRPDEFFYGIQLKQGDRFVETFYLQRWYNVFAVYDRDDDHFKGWYCNVASPAKLKETAVDGLTISYIDLALDLLVFPDGRQLVLDEDEFDALPLSPEIQTQARQALGELCRLFKTYPPPYSGGGRR